MAINYLNLYIFSYENWKDRGEALERLAMRTMKLASFEPREIFLSAPERFRPIRIGVSFMKGWETALSKLRQDALAGFRLTSREMVDYTSEYRPAYQFEVSFLAYLRTYPLTRLVHPDAPPVFRRSEMPQVLSVRIDTSRRSPQEANAIARTLLDILRESVADLNACHGYVDAWYTEPQIAALQASVAEGLVAEYDEYVGVREHVARPAWGMLLTMGHGDACRILRGTFDVTPIDGVQACLVRLSPIILDLTATQMRRFIELAPALLPVKRPYRPGSVPSRDDYARSMLVDERLAAHLPQEALKEDELPGKLVHLDSGNLAFLMSGPGFHSLEEQGLMSPEMARWINRYLHSQKVTAGERVGYMLGWDTRPLTYHPRKPKPWYEVGEGLFADSPWLWRVWFKSDPRPKVQQQFSQVLEQWAKSSYPEPLLGKASKCFIVEPVQFTGNKAQWRTRVEDYNGLAYDDLLCMLYGFHDATAKLMAILIGDLEKPSF